MSDDLTKRRPQDPTKINTHESWEIDYWCRKWGITKQQLLDAVKKVGNGTKKVAELLGKTP